MMDPRDEDGYYPGKAFYAEAEPCESCGEPTFAGRIWNPEHELWIAVDCNCNAPSLPTCPDLVPLLARVDTVREVCQVIRAHRATCSLCRPIEMQPRQEPAITEKEAA